MRNTIGLLVILAFLLGSCTAMAGGIQHWPASLIAVAVIVLMKIANDRYKVLNWPLEFLLASGVVMIVINLGRLYIIPMPY
ncbi:hypothetical protein [Amorphus orientalis]|uniref:Membrane protein AbrB (Regulator of aidB expression) n=1 Tax=Amorphus orientalis TaxID=649198 RepID=A0AAE3VPS5_9HYPH|nr:hypothetical protein [Amorphus orientalis]MDQ0315901.1 putative membrane protein AbrB (regulator of aidB expression) [Amorphus orientalis]